MNGALVIIADSSAIMKENVYYIHYKSHSFKYIKSNHPQRTDWMIGFYKNDDQDTIYKMMSEFLRAFAFSKTRGHHTHFNRGATLGEFGDSIHIYIVPNAQMAQK